uniref:Thioredoxin domain-containing protein n=1 Tax=Panagrellus redivivus TaxID=6233 RepID=A0A7E4W326_PANRE
MSTLGLVSLGRTVLRSTRVANACAVRWTSSDGSGKKPPAKPDDAAESGKNDPLKIDLKELEKNLEDSLSTGKTEAVDPRFMSFKKSKERASHERSFIFTWRTTIFTLGIGGIGLTWLLYMRKMREAEMEKQKKVMAGKAKIGGEWELVNTDGKLSGSADLKGQWVLIYFGFTHCPDICPDEIEKMVSVVEILQEGDDKVPIVPVFISVDPERDTVDRVKRYCEEFSPLIKGYTGSKEQVAKVAKTFRVYHSQGPKTAEDDYIVDHTVIMYLIDPDGVFHDYYGQNRRAREIANIIKTKVLKYEVQKRKANSFF